MISLMTLDHTFYISSIGTYYLRIILSAHSKPMNYNNMLILVGKINRSDRFLRIGIIMFPFVRVPLPFIAINIFPAAAAVIRR